MEVLCKVIKLVMLVRFVFISGVGRNHLGRCHINNSASPGASQCRTKRVSLVHPWAVTALVHPCVVTELALPCAVTTLVHPCVVTALVHPCAVTAYELRHLKMGRLGKRCVIVILTLLSCDV